MGVEATVNLESLDSSTRLLLSVSDMNQPTLPGFHPFMKAVRPRPAIHDPEIVKAAARALVKHAKKVDGSLTQEDEGELVAQVQDAISHETDGYAICRALERDGWDPDAALVGVFDAAEVEKRSVLDKAVLFWVKDTQTTLRFSVGQNVEFSWHGKKKKIVGTITRLDPERARYTVYSEQLGHVQTGSGVRGVVLDDECCALVGEKP